MSVLVRLMLFKLTHCLGVQPDLAPMIFMHFKFTHCLGVQPDLDRMIRNRVHRTAGDPIHESPS